MTTRYLKHILICTAAITIMIMVGLTSAQAKTSTTKYTKERPLRIVSDWNFAPYEYTNDKGEAEGYTISILESILDKLEIPHEFIQRKLDHAVVMFNSGQADLMIEAVNSKWQTNGKPYYSRKVLAPYKLKVAYHKDSKPLTSLKDMTPSDTIVLKKYDYSTKMILKRNDINFKQIAFSSPRSIIQKLNNGSRLYFIWGEKPIEKILRELNISNIEIEDIDIMSGEMRFVSYDEQLIYELDEQFARMEQSGEISKLKKKWFHPEINDNDASPVVVIIIVIAIVVIIIAFIANQLITARIKKNTQLSAEKNNIMLTALDMSRNDVITIDLKRNHISNIYGSHVPEGGIPLSLYREKIHPDDRRHIDRLVEDSTTANNRSSKNHTYRWNAGTDEQPDWRVIYNHSIREKGKNGNVTDVICTLTDITDDLDKEQNARETAMTYSNMFEMSIVGLSLHDTQGNLINTNLKMRELMKFESTDDEFYYKKCWFDFPSIKNVLSNDITADIHFCTKIDVPERKVSEYIEIRIRPITDDEGNIVYILIAAISVSTERSLYLQRKKNNDTLRIMRREATRSENEMRYLLNESKTRVWRSSFADKTLTFYKSLHNQDTTISMDEMVANTFYDEDKAQMHNFIQPQADDITPKTMIIAMRENTPDGPEKHWYSINRIPNYGNNGKAEGCFGLIRDITDLIEAQEKLRQETQRANESEQQKSVFLANMSHEIRTPLNAIVGFCDLLQTVDNAEDRKEFIRIIRSNCNMLLHIINDVLIISSMDANGLTIEPHDIDFAAAFDDICATFVLQVAEKGISLIKENPYSQFCTQLDKERIQQVIVNFMTNAIKHTREGHIRVGYRIEDEGIRIYCEDTGSGIPKEKYEDVFRRFVKLNDFVQGTGLGLSICKAIADGCNGRIGIDSEEGKGSTFWIWIPCDITKAVPRKNTENNNVKQSEP